jgi:excisionase family DNA binding protein
VERQKKQGIKKKKLTTGELKQKVPPQFLGEKEEAHMESFVAAKEVAQFLGMSPRTIAKMAREGRIPAHPVSGSARRTWRFKLSEVESSLALASQLHRPILSERPGCSAESE